MNECRLLNHRSPAGRPSTLGSKGMLSASALRSISLCCFFKKVVMAATRRSTSLSASLQEPSVAYFLRLGLVRKQVNTASIDEALVGHAVWDCEFTSNTQRRLICDDFEGWAKDRVQILTDVMPIRCQRCMNNAAPWLCVTSEIGCLPPRAPIQGALGTGGGRGAGAPRAHEFERVLANLRMLQHICETQRFSAQAH